jgi:hypothetical protein
MLVAALQEAFAELDKDGDGHLTPAELHAALRSTGALAKAGLAAEIDPHVLEVRTCGVALVWRGVLRWKAQHR